SAFHRGAAAEDRPRPRDRRVPQGAARVRTLLREVARFRHLSVAGVPEGDEELSDDRHWMYGWAAPLGGHRAAAGRRPAGAGIFRGDRAPRLPPLAYDSPSQRRPRLIGALIVTHGHLANELLNAARRIETNIG